MIFEGMMIVLLCAIVYMLTFSYPLLTVFVSAAICLIAIEEWIRLYRFRGVDLGSKKIFWFPRKGFKRMIVVKMGHNVYWYGGGYIVRQNKVNGFMLWKYKEEYYDSKYDRMLRKKELSLEDVAYLNMRELDVMKY